MGVIAWLSFVFSQDAPTSSGASYTGFVATGLSEGQWCWLLALTVVLGFLGLRDTKREWRIAGVGLLATIAV